MNLSDRCQQAYKRIQEWRDLGVEAFDPHTDRMYLHDLVQDLQDAARKEGCVTASIDDPTVDQALNVVAEILGWSQQTQSVLPAGTSLKEWYTPNELAELMGRSSFTVREKWCNDGRIECEKNQDSGKWRIPGREVNRLLNGGGLAPKQGR